MSQKHENLNFEIYEENVIFASVFKVCICSTIKIKNRIHSFRPRLWKWYTGAGVAKLQLERRRQFFEALHAALCAFRKIVYLFFFFSVANCRNIVKCYCGSCRAVQYCVCKSIQKELMSQNILQINPCF